MVPDLTIERLHSAYRDGLPVEQVVADVYRRIEAASDPGIFLSLLPEADACRAAAALGAFDPVNKPLWGIPFAVKDNIDVAGLPTTAGCPAFAYKPATNATAVQRLIDAGAIVIGKTNLDQFATGLVGMRTPYPVPRNAIDPSLVPGGSSSGSAVAVARGIVTFALGTDTAGSGRVPAALNNIVGLKPSVGAVSTTGVVPACRTLDCVSVFALTAGDAWTVLTAMAGFDRQDPYSRPVALAARGIPPGLRIGVPDDASLEFFGDGLAAAAFAASRADVAAMGGVLVPVDLTPFRRTAELLYAGPWVAERYQAVRGFIETSPEDMNPIVRTIIDGARKFTAADAFAGLYRLMELRRATETIWNDIDVLVVPSIPTIATLEGIAQDPIALNSKLGTYTNFVNLLDLAALAIPGRWRTDGRPAGITLIGPRGSDGLLAGLGAHLHARAGVTLGAVAVAVPEPRITTAPSSSDWQEVVVVGAHMSGLPLNPELRALGARFVRRLDTERIYRLFALPGGPPHRPGLLRTGNDDGRAIDVEVWAMPTESIGRLVAAIPAPLGIGTVRLSDGTAPKGFLVEAEGTVGARDISHYGGWRAYTQVAAHS